MGLAHTSHAMSLPAPSALKEAVPSHTTQVYWRRGGWWGPGIGLGIAAGAFTAAAVASRPYWGGGYWGGGYPGYAYAPAYYDYGYDYAPGYSYADPPTYGYAPLILFLWARLLLPYGTTYVRPRARYAYGRVGPPCAMPTPRAVRHTYSSGPRYRAIGSRSADRVVNRRR